MVLRREAQRAILAALNEVYPAAVDGQHGLGGLTFEVTAPNLAYLEEHGLVAAKWTAILREPARPFSAKITAKGIDFLADDGGLSAILGVVIVKIHEDSIKALLVEQVEASPANPTVKSKLKQQIAALPAEALKTITTEGLKAGLARMPDAIQWLQKWLSH